MDSAELTAAVAAMERQYTPLSAACKADFLPCCRVIRAEKGDVLVREGSYSELTWFIASGGLRAWYLKDGKDITDWFAFENHFVCSIHSYFMRVPSMHTFEVLEPTVLIAFSRTDVERLCQTHIDMERLCRISITQTMLQLQQRIAGLQFETARQKLDNLLLARPDILQRTPLTHIASYLGITLETLSRIRHPRKARI